MTDIRLSFVIVIFLFLFSATAFTDNARVALTVKVSGATSGKGQVILSLFSSADTYLKNPVVSETAPVNKQGKVTFSLDKLKAGVYAVSVVYDEDSNGELNTGFLGIPSELVGFSNNVVSMFGPPSFGDVSFHLSESAAIEIVLGGPAD